MASSRLPAQPTLRPFDVAVALRLLLEPEERYEPLAQSLATSTSAVHRAVGRLQLSGLLRGGSRTVARPALREFLLHGVRYAFPPILGVERAGLVTAWGHGDLSAVLQAKGVTDPPRPLVWAREGGAVTGETILPLFPGAADAAIRDPRLHALLAAVDALRAGTPAVRRVVGEHLAERVLWASSDS